MTKKEIYIGLGILAFGGILYHLWRRNQQLAAQQAYLQQAQAQAQNEQQDEQGSFGGGGGGGGSFSGLPSTPAFTPTTTIITPPVIAPISEIPVSSASPQVFSKPMSTTMISGSTQAANLLPTAIQPKAGIGETGSAFQSPSSGSFGSSTPSSPTFSSPSSPSLPAAAPPPKTFASSVGGKQVSFAPKPTSLAIK